ncbi:TLC domain-containing protein 5-like isoform X1 [Tripterygium wilfordii]|uniref:TLC domain-containing protein 5-like isoform X1 n=1 Tax=Tripterygium wilfordii TaxID=458696 RepID=UPI0018F81951|nr:TLC domain-containing protein 5-like isoform X1 [Tripterygium wilfordii]
MNDHIVKIVVWGLVSWSITFLVIRRILLPNRSFGFCNRVVSTIHAALAVILASLSVEDWSCPVCPLASQSSPSQVHNCLFKMSFGSCNKEKRLICVCLCFTEQMKAIAVSLSYLIYDLICSLFDKQAGLDNTIHHLVSIVGSVAGLTYKRCGSEMAAALWMTEISSPFLHAREILKELGYKDTDLNFAADMSFAVIFSTARMVGGPFLTYVTLRAANPFIIKAMALGLQLVSAFWFYKIARMAMYKLRRRSTFKKAPSYYPNSEKQN